jgi:hypothetical protein
MLITILGGFLMKEERMKVLDMLEKGTISAAEATDLLGQLGTAKSDDDKLAEFANSVAVFAKDVGEKTKEVCATVSPKLKDATKAVVKKTAEVVDSMSKSLNEAVKKMECELKDCTDENCECKENTECTEDDKSN